MAAAEFMLSQTELDTVLNDAQAAVETLANDVSSTLEPALKPQSTAPTEAEASVPVPATASTASDPGNAPSDSSPKAPSSDEPASMPSPSTTAGTTPRPAPPALVLSPKLNRVLKLRVPVVVRLAQRPIRLAEILKLTPGNILEFERTVDSELDLMVNNQVIGSGKAVKVNERFGLRIQSVGDPRQRLRQLTSG